MFVSTSPWQKLSLSLWYLLLLSVWLDICLIVMLLSGASFLYALGHDLHPQFVQFSLFVLKKSISFWLLGNYMHFMNFISYILKLHVKRWYPITRSTHFQSYASLSNRSSIWLSVTIAQTKQKSIKDSFSVMGALNIVHMIPIQNKR